jgi:hypothetical protein
MVDHATTLAVKRASQHNRRQRLKKDAGFTLARRQLGDGMTEYLRTFRGKVIEIDSLEAVALNSALDATYAQIAFEELWDAVIQNFVDLERDMLIRGIEDMVFGDGGWNHYHDMRTLFGRRLANLLSSCRAYMRQIATTIDLPGQFSKLKSAAYDTHFSYRLMEALRNYTQHYGSPITGTHMDMRRIEQPSGDQYRHVTAASMNAATLRDDPKIKASIRAELAGMGKLEVSKFAREYLEQLAGVHLEVRGAMAGRVADDRARVAGAIERIRQVRGDSDFGEYLAVWADGKEQTRRALMIEPFERLQALRHRNRSLQNLSSRYVSGELLGQYLK